MIDKIAYERDPARAGRFAGSTAASTVESSLKARAAAHRDPCFLVEPFGYDLVDVLHHERASIVGILRDGAGGEPARKGLDDDEEYQRRLTIPRGAAARPSTDIELQPYAKRSITIFPHRRPRESASSGSGRS